MLDIDEFSYKEVSFCIPSSNVWEYLFPWLHSQIVFLSFWILASLIGKKWCLKVLIVLIYVFLIMVVKEYLFIYLMTYNKNCPPKMIFLCLLSLFLLSLILFFLPLFKSSSYMGILDFLWYMLPMSISPSLSFFVVVFTLFIVFLPCKSCWIFFFNCPWVLSDSWKVLPYTQVIEESNPCCPLVPIINFFFTFRYLIHLEFILVYGVRNGLKFIFFQMVIQLSQHHLLKKNYICPVMRDTTFIIC